MATAKTLEETKFLYPKRSKIYCIQSTRLKILTATIAVTFLSSACDTYGPIVRNDPGTTYGEIKVSTPRIAGRERLINDRLEQERWISGQLGRVNESMLGFDGLVELRNIASSNFQLRAQSDPSFQVYKLQQEQTASRLQNSSKAEQEIQQFRLTAIQDVNVRFKKKELTYAQAVDEFEKLGVTVPAASVSTALTGAPGVSSASLPPASENQGMSGTTAMNSAAVSAASGSTASPSGLRGSPIDNFRDLMAVMEEMRSARLSNALDDAHDLDGNTLYRLTFDVTVLPENNTSAWAIVEVEVDPTAPNFDHYDVLIERLRTEYERAVHESIDQPLQRIKIRFINNCSKEPTTRAALLCSTSFLSERVRAELRSALNLIPDNELSENRDLSIFSKRLTDRTSNNLVEKLSPESQLVSFEDTVREVLFLIELRRFGDNSLSCFFDLTRSDPRLSVGFSRPPLHPRVKLRDKIEKFDFKLLFRHQCDIYTDSLTRTKSVKSFFYRHTRASVYAVTPVETVQRLSEIATARSARELLLGLSAANGAGSVSAGMQQLRSNEALAQAIRRQPVVVGFGGGVGANGKAVKFGWIIGPQFNMSADGKTTNFRHAVKQYAVSALVSLPSWMANANLLVKTSWIPEQGRQVRGIPLEKVSNQEVRLPSKMRVAIDSFEYGDRAVEPDEFQHIEVVEDKPASVLITGRGLWRSTDVYIGSQQADSVTVLPNMLGVRADFNKIRAPHGSQLNTADGNLRTVNLIVFTSEGSKVAGSVQVK